MYVNWNPDWHKAENMCANLLVTFGCRAGEMNAGGHISLPGDEQGEDKLAALGIAVSHEWMSGGAEEFSFDEFIEEVLLKHFPKED